MPAFICPLCRSPLATEAKTWRCANRHSFDVAREGYVNLLPVQHKHSREPGDSAEMVAARREFLDAGHYLPLREAIVALLAPLAAKSLLDLGCGEGWYTGALAAVAKEVVGLDIAKPAVQLAAKRHKNIRWIVGSSAHLPLADSSVDLLASLFTPLNVPEMRRVLAPGGHLLLVTPAPDHLWSLRERLFDEVRPHEPDKFLASLGEGFELRTRQEIAFSLELRRDDLRRLLAMTPYAWKAKPERRAELEESASLHTEAAFALLLLQGAKTGFPPSRE